MVHLAEVARVKGLGDLRLRFDVASGRIVGREAQYGRLELALSAKVPPLGALQLHCEVLLEVCVEVGKVRLP